VIVFNYIVNTKVCSIQSIRHQVQYILCIQRSKVLKSNKKVITCDLGYLQDESEVVQKSILHN